jgi:malonate transporter and related proteins
VALLTGFSTILLVIGCGGALAQAGVLDIRSQRTLGEIAFFVASPALMVVTISEVEVSGASANLAASAVSLAVAFGTYVLIARRSWRHDVATTVIGALASSYVNAGNLGIAVAAYVVGDITVVVPTLLVQMLVVQPIALAVLDHQAGRGSGTAAVLRRLATNPLTLAALLGVVLAATGWQLPLVVDQPLRLVAGAAIPLMLIAYGAALRLSPLPGRAGANREVATIAVLKIVVMPVVAWAVAVGLGLDGTALLGVVITAALPTAQNIFLHATRYDIGNDIAREAILLTTLCSLPTALVVALLLG